MPLYPSTRIAGRLCPGRRPAAATQPPIALRAFTTPRKGKHVRFEGRRRRWRHDGRGDRPGNRRRRHPCCRQGHRPEVRRRRGREGARRHRGPARPPGQEGEADPGAGRRAPRRGNGPGHRDDDLRGVRRRRLRGRGGAREDGDQAGGLRRARRRHSRPRDPRLQHLLALDHRDGGDDAAPRQGRRLPLLLPRLGDAAGRGDRRRRHLARDCDRRLQLRAGDQEAADRLWRGPRLRRQQNPDGDDRRDLARPGGERPLPEGDRRGDRGRQGRPDGPLLPHRPARTRHGPPRRRAPQRVLRRDLLRPPGPQAAGRRRQAGRQVRRRGLLQRRRADGARRRRARRRGAGRDVHRDGR